MPNKAIGKRFKQWRLDKNMTQQAMGKILNRSQSHIYEVEKRGGGFSQASLAILAHKLDLDINWLLTGKTK